jgi:hypothetical protein
MSERTWLAALIGAIMVIGGYAPTASAVAPPPVAGFDYQLGGGYTPPAGVRTVVRDRTERPAAGYYNVCYVNGFQTQPGELRWWRRHHPGLLLRKGGRLVEDEAWGEVLLDTSAARKRARLARIVGRWIEKCAADGYQAVEPDNLDSFSRSKGRLTARDNLALAGLLIKRAHRAGLAIGQKNSPQLSTRGKRRGFDFAVAEECAVWSECGAYTRVYGEHVLEIEYTDNGRPTWAAACRAAGARHVILRDRDLRPAGTKGYVFRSC